MQIQILNNWRAEIGELDGELVAITHAVDKLGYWDAAITQQERQEKRDHLAAKVKWLEGELDKVRRLSGNHPTRFRIPLKGARPDPTADDDYSLGFDATLRRLAHLADPGRLLSELCRQLAVPIETIDFVEPVNLAYVERQRQENKEIQQFEQGKKELFKMVEAYARKKGDVSGWPLREALAVYSKGVLSNMYPKTKAGLLAFRRDLGEAKLLSVSDRFETTIEGMLAKARESISL